MYETTLLPRTRDITPDDFQDLAESCCLSQTSRMNGVSRLDDWNEYMPLLPQEIADMFETLPIPNLQLIVRNQQAHIFIFKLDDDQTIIDDVTFGFDLKKNQLLFSTMKLNEQGKGIGTKIAKARLELAMALGLPGLEFGAGLTNGAYTWARCGFELSKDAKKDYLSASILGRLLTVKDHLPRELFTACKTWSTLSNVDDITKLAAQDFELPAHLTIDDFDLRNIERHSLLASAFATVATVDHQEGGLFAELHKIQSLLSRRDTGGMPIRLGQFLLYGSEWKASLDFSNVRQMHKVEKGLGGFTYIAYQPEKKVAARPTRSSFYMAQGFAP